MRKMGLPLPASALEPSGGITLKWEEIAWGQASVVVKGRERSRGAGAVHPEVRRKERLEGVVFLGGVLLLFWRDKRERKRKESARFLGEREKENKKEREGVQKKNQQHTTTFPFFLLCY